MRRAALATNTAHVAAAAGTPFEVYGRPCPSCNAPAGDWCRTRFGGRVAHAHRGRIPIPAFPQPGESE